MKKIITFLLSLLFILNITACSASYETIPEEYINANFNGELEVFYGKYASDLFKALYVGSEVDDEEFLARVEKGSDDAFAQSQKRGVTYKYKHHEVYKEYTSDEVKDYNKFYQHMDVEKFSDLVHLTIYYDQYQNDVFEKELYKGMLLGKVNGEWKLIRFFG